MLLSVRALKAVADVNTFSYADSFSYNKGDSVSLYFQLIDISLDTAMENFIPPGRRYMPASGATLQAVVENIDDAIQITRFATQPFPLDPSIWKITMLSSDAIEGTCNLRLTLTEGSKVTHCVVKNIFKIQSDRNLC